MAQMPCTWMYQHSTGYYPTIHWVFDKIITLFIQNKLNIPYLISYYIPLKKKKFKIVSPTLILIVYTLL